MAVFSKDQKSFNFVNLIDSRDAVENFLSLIHISTCDAPLASF